LLLFYHCLLLFYQCFLVPQARHGQLNAMGWFGNIGIASPAGPSDLQSNPDAMLNSEHLLVSHCLPSTFKQLGLIPFLSQLPPVFICCPWPATLAHAFCFLPVVINPISSWPVAFVMQHLPLILMHASTGPLAHVFFQ